MDQNDATTQKPALAIPSASPSGVEPTFIFIWRKLGSFGLGFRVLGLGFRDSLFSRELARSCCWQQAAASNRQYSGYIRIIFGIMEKKMPTTIQGFWV